MSGLNRIGLAKALQIPTSPCLFCPEHSRLLGPASAIGFPLPLWRHTVDELLAAELDEEPDEPESGQCFVELDDDPPVVARTWAGVVLAAGLTVAPAIDATPIPSPRQPATTPAPRRGRVSFMFGFLSRFDAGLGALPP